MREEPSHLLVWAAVTGGPLKGVWVLHQLEGQNSNEDEHFTNISVEIWVQSFNMYGFLGLSSNLRGICCQ